MTRDYDEESGEPSDEFFQHAYEDAWNDPWLGRDMRRRYAKEQCTRIKVDGRDWLDCEDDGDEILRLLGSASRDSDIRGRFRVEDFDDETKFTEEEGLITIYEARSSVTAGKLRAKLRAENEALGLER